MIKLLCFQSKKESGLRAFILFIFQIFVNVNKPDIMKSTSSAEYVRQYFEKV